MKKISLLAFVLALIMASCTDPDLIGLEVQPESDNIIISTTSFQEISSSTESVDSMPTSALYNDKLILGQINDIDFGFNQGTFYTQILLSENNIDLGNNPSVDSVILSYTYSGYYGSKTPEIDEVEVNRINEDIYQDSIYYSNSFQIIPGNGDWIETFSLSKDTTNPFLRFKLKNEFIEDIFDESMLIDNETFLQQFKGISVLAHTTNTMLYLNPNGSNSFFKIYYHNDENDSLSLNFEVGGNAARINLFNDKEESSIIENEERLYIQSMGGYQVKISIGDISSLKEMLEDKLINKVELTFSVAHNSQEDYDANNRLYLIRVADNEGNHAPLLDLENGEYHFGGWLDNDEYKFNITRYFVQLLQNDNLIQQLYLQPYNRLFDEIDEGKNINANRTILDKEIKLKIYYSAL